MVAYLQIRGKQINVLHINQTFLKVAKIYSEVLKKLGNFPVVTFKVHKIENFFGSEFEFYTISLLFMLKY